jgi:hypothetical protein
VGHRALGGPARAGEPIGAEGTERDGQDDRGDRRPALGWGGDEEDDSDAGEGGRDDQRRGGARRT